MFETWQILALAALVISLIFSGLCRSLVHILLHHYNSFKLKFGITDDQWWNPAISHTNKNNIKWTIDLFGLRWVTKILVQFSDAFHLFNMLELISDHAREALYFSIFVSFVYGFFFGQSVLIFLAAILLHGGIKILAAFNYGYDRLWR